MSYLKIVQLMQLAHEKIQYPRIHLNNGYVLQRASRNAKYPGSINITDGKPYGQNQWYGNIATHGGLSMPNYQQKHSEELQTELALFQLDPAKYAKGYGKATANCMFCFKELTDPQSVAVGYGPICASNYGLPHGKYSKEDAKAMSSLGFDLGELESELPKNEAWNANKTLCNCGIYPPDMECMHSGECKRNPVIAESLAIEKLRDVLILQLSERQQENYAELIKENPADAYSILITALWENL